MSRMCISKGGYCVNPFQGMDGQTIASVVIIGLVLTFLTLIIIFTYVRNAGWKVLGVLMLLVLGGIALLARG